MVLTGSQSSDPFDSPETINSRARTVEALPVNHNNTHRHKRHARRLQFHRKALLTRIFMPETSLPPGKDPPALASNSENKFEANGQQVNGLIPLNEQRECDVIRIILQALRSWGYENSAQALEAESNVTMESTSVRYFRDCILEGRWNEATISIPLSNQTKYEILRERYLELLEARQLKEALDCLRQEVTPLAPNIQSIKQLASLMMSNSSQEVRAKAQWTGAGVASRFSLLSRIQALMPGLMLPEQRLEELLRQALLYQQGKCRNHYPGPQLDGIIIDHHCQDTDLQLRLGKSLRGHVDEVWHAAFSHDSQFLATSSKEGTVIIWKIPEGKIHQQLKGHQAGVVFIAWSPDDTALLTCSMDGKARIFDPLTGECQRRITTRREVTAGAWTDAGKSIIIASHDGLLGKYSRDGTCIITISLRVLDMARLDEDRIAVLDTKSTVRILGTNDFQEIFKFSECAPISSLAANRTGTYFLLNSAEAEAEVNLWGPSDTLPGTYDIICTLYGHTNQKYCLRSCFGHPTEILIVNGCEKGDIYTHHRDHGHLIQKLSGHKGAVNCLTWTDAHGGILASVGDDHQVCLWIPLLAC